MQNLWEISVKETLLVQQYIYSLLEQQKLLAKSNPKWKALEKKIKEQQELLGWFIDKE